MAVASLLTERWQSSLEQVRTQANVRLGSKSMLTGRFERSVPRTAIGRRPTFSGPK